MLIEVIACSLNDAIEAEKGGAGRVELVRALDKEGLTPALDLVEEVLARVSIPVRVMIREHDHFAAGDVREIDRLATAAAECAALGCDGVVLGFLRGGWIDEVAIQTVLGAAAPVRATFHRAFDELPDPVAAVTAVGRWPQIDRVLTTGGAVDWTERIARMTALAKAAATRLTIIAGGGIDVAAIPLLAKSGIHEAHVGRAAREPSTVDGAVSSRTVARLVEAAGR